MGRQLAESLPPARRLFDEASQVLGYDLAQVCFEGPAERLNSTAVSQPAIFVASMAALESLEASTPDVVSSCAGAAGLSLGEYTALVFAGAMSFADGLRVVRRRGEAMQAAADATPSAMLSVLGLEVPRVEELCAAARDGGTLQVANLLCPGNTVVSGARTVRLAVAGAFHTPLMKPADAQLAGALSEIEIRSPRLPVWSNVDALPHQDPEEIRRILVRQVLQPVLWEESMRQMLAAGFDLFYEIGPGRVLAGLLKRVNRKTECRNVPA